MEKRFSTLKTISLISSFCISHSLYCVSLSELKQFVNEFIKHPTTVGAFAPCSSFVGKEITKYFVNFIEHEKPSKPLHVLEVGAGTGSLTQEIEKIINAHPETTIIADIVEISPEFCKILDQKFSNNPKLSVHCASILDWQPDFLYDFIICTLPFNSFEGKLMQSIISHLTKLITPGGVLSYVAYAGIADIKKYLLWGKAKKEHIEKMNTLQSMRDKYQIDARTVIINCPPIRIYHLQIV